MEGRIIMSDLEAILLKYVKVICDGEWSLLGTPDDLLTALTEREERIKKEAVAEAQANWSIMGKKPEEVYTILRALEFERIADIKVTMSNLDAISKLIQEDLRNANQRAINRVFEQFKTPELTKNTNSRKGK